MKSILFGLTRQYFLALSTVAAPLWLAVVLLLVGGPWLGQVLMVAASGGEVDPDALPTDKLRLLCHLMATVFFGMGTVVGLFQTPTYVFRLPISSRLLVTWQFLMTAMTIAFANAVMTVSYWLLFDTSLPYASTLPMITAGHLLIWLVWLFVPSITASAQATTSLHAAPLRRQLAFTIRRVVKWLPLAFAFGAYIVFRAWRQAPSEFWASVTVVDIAALTSISGLTWKLISGEIERQRHGDINFRSLMERETESSLARAAQQDVPAPGEWSLQSAHDWYHWQAGRTLLILGAMFVVPLLLVIFTLMYFENGPNRIEGVVAMLTMMPILGALLTGATLGLGTVNPAGRREMRKHVAVLPVSDRDLSRTMLVMFVKTLSRLWALIFVMCVIAIVFFVTSIGFDNALKEMQRQTVVQNLGLWAIPLHLVLSIQAMWTVGGLTATLAWTGREQFFSKVYVALVITGLPSMVGVKIFVPVAQQLAVFTGILSVLALATLGLVAWTYRQSLRRRLMEPGLAHAAFVFWAVEVGLCLVLLPAPFLMRIAIAGLIGLSVLPITASPLAVAWNRHR